MTAIGLEEPVRAIEPSVTEAMATAPPIIRRQLILLLAAYAGISPKGLRLVSGHDRQWRRPGIRLVIELKAYAAINGRWGYCRLARDGYSSQVICYAENDCWTHHDLTGAKFLLIAPTARFDHLQAYRRWAVDHYDGTVGPDRWQFVDLGLLYRDLIAIAERSGPCQAHAAVLVRLIGHWWWQWIPPEVPLVIA